MKTEDALAFLELVKAEFDSKSQTYLRFLEVMKAFKRAE